MIKNWIKIISVKLYFGNSFFRKGVKFGRGAFIREHTKISGGVNIVLGDNARIYPYSRIECFEWASGEKFTPKIRIGNNVLLGRNSTILCCNEVNIGDDCLFASYCTIIDENHGMDPSLGIRYEAQKLDVKNVDIGRNCWIGEKVIILPGVSIGDNAVIGAGSVVTKSIPADSIAVGNPARVVKKFDYIEKKWKKVEGE